MEIKEFIRVNLMGSCVALYEVVEYARKDLNLPDSMSDDEVEDELVEHLEDAQVFCCANCNWWCDVSELVHCEDESICSDCDVENDEE